MVSHCGAALRGGSHDSNQVAIQASPYVMAVLCPQGLIHCVKAMGHHCFQRLNPILFNLKSHVQGVATFLGCIYEVQYMEFQVRSAMVIGAVEMSSYVILHIPPANDPKVSLESVHEGAPSLAHILFLASFASDTVDQFIALAGDIAFTDKCLLRVTARDSSTVV